MVLQFEKQFVDHIRYGRKKQTVREKGGQIIRVGDLLELQYGPRYGTKILIGRTVCTKIQTIVITRKPLNSNEVKYIIEVDGLVLTAEQIEDFIIADGFTQSDATPDYKRFWAYFDREKFQDYEKKLVDGFLYHWGQLAAEQPTFTF